MSTLNGLALCAGIGGLELGLQLAIGPEYRCVGYCERDAFAAASLVARMEDSALDPAPIWDDLKTFPGELYRGRVDLISAGFPCQPFSVAGKHAGTDDARWIWPDIARIIRDVGPRYVFLENVPGLLAHSGGFGTVLGDLAESGFDAEWDVFSAAGVGAPHLRRRLFILAWRIPDVGNAPIPRLERRGEPVPARPTLRQYGRPGRKVGNAEGTGGPELPIGGAAKFSQPFPPGPRDEAGWVEVLQRDPALEPAIRGVADGVPAWVDRLRCCGNGVVPIVAAVAFRVLAARAW